MPSCVRVTVKTEAMTITTALYQPTQHFENPRRFPDHDLFSSLLVEGEGGGGEREQVGRMS